MQPNPLKKKLKREALQGLAQALRLLLASPVESDDDKLHFAVLAEIALMAEKKLFDMRREYLISFTPAQALAIRILATDYMHTDKTSHVGNIIHQISNQAHKQYA